MSLLTISRRMVSKDCQDPESLSDIDGDSTQQFCDAYDERDVDRSLIRFCLFLSPTEWVKSVEGTLNALVSVRRVEPVRISRQK